MSFDFDESIGGVPLLDLAAQWGQVEADVREAIERVLSTQRYIGGPEVEGAEADVLEYCRMDGAAIGVASGTDALLVAMMALDIGPGDEVVTTPFTFFATAGTIHRTGAKPVFVDIDPATFNIDPTKIADAITDKTKAVVPVHLFGQCAEMDAIKDAVGGLPIIEDAAQAIGAEYKGARAGAMGAAGCFSFFPSKNLGVLGDGGMVVSTDKALGERMRRLRNHGQGAQYHHEEVGGNFRLDAIHGAAVRAKLPYLDGWTEGRQRNADRYDAMFAEAGLVGEHILALPARAPERRHIFNQYTLRVRDRDALQAFLRDEAKIGTSVYYPVPMHLQRCFADLGYKAGDMPEAEKAAREVLSLPIFPELTEAQQRYVVGWIARFYGEG
ncbi:MAG: DegT/DnrJ/EryC1/StrS family aminotransferase [Deltaproteobacteria bacterium]|nr:DegT/DnrJ/EryC1/StrS family aminotransferase [Deltaproteobacteria bacterium]